VPGGAPSPTLRAADRHDPGWSNLAALVRQVFSLPPDVIAGWWPLDYCGYYGLGVVNAKTLLRLGANPLAMRSTITLATTRHAQHHHHAQRHHAGGDRRHHLASAGLCGRVKATGAVLREASMPWSPQRHALHCPKFRRVVEVLLLVEQRARARARQRESSEVLAEGPCGRELRENTGGEADADADADADAAAAASGSSSESTTASSKRPKMETLPDSTPTPLANLQRDIWLNMVLLFLARPSLARGLQPASGTFLQ
jgi:hypothetical protein